MKDPPVRILIIGGGHVGLTAALRLEGRLRAGEAEVMLADPRTYMTYQPLLAEAAAGNVEPRHVAVPLRRVLPNTEIIAAELVDLDHGNRRAVLRLASGEHREVGYDHIVLAPGSVARTLPSQASSRLASASPPSARRSTYATTCSNDSASPHPPRTRTPASAR